jgi:hypothetical protein
MYNASRMHIFETALRRDERWVSVKKRQTYEDLIQEVLDELLLQRSGCKQAVKIRAEQFCDEIPGKWSEKSGNLIVRCVQILKRRDEDVAETDNLHFRLHCKR